MKTDKNLISLKPPILKYHAKIENNTIFENMKLRKTEKRFTEYTEPLVLKNSMLLVKNN